MDDSTDREDMQVYDLLDLLDQAWLKIPLAAMQEVGPAAQTLGGFMKITNKETFVPTAKIAEEARVPLRAARKHLDALAAHGWVENHGRGRTRSGRPRRTATRTLTVKCQKNLVPFGVLPRWAMANIRSATNVKSVKRLKWSTKAVLSVIMGRLLSLKAVVEREDLIDDEQFCDQDGDGTFDVITDPKATDKQVADALALEDTVAAKKEQFEKQLLIDAIEELNSGDNRFCFSLKSLMDQTGLSRHAIIEAKRRLSVLGIIKWVGDKNTTDNLQPNWDFEVVETPANPGYIYLDFRHPVR